MRALAPWKGMDTFRQEMEQLFDRFFDLRGGEAAGAWAPKLDLSETKDAYVIKAEIPGVEQKDLSVSLQNQILTIKGEKHQEKEEKDEQHHRIERSWGEFSRSIMLPGAAETEKVDATFKNGLLTITLPKTQAAKGT